MTRCRQRGEGRGISLCEWREGLRVVPPPPPRRYKGLDLFVLSMMMKSALVTLL